MELSRLIDTPIMISPMQVVSSRTQQRDVQQLLTRDFWSN